MKIVFLGLGSIGQRHVKLLLQDYNHELFALRTSKGQKVSILPIKEIYSWDEFKKIGPDIVFITNPTSLHIETAIKCARQKCSLFIEKPLGSSLEKLDELLDIVRSNGLTTYVAYNLRFHPIIRTLKEYTNIYAICHLRVTASSYLPNWRSDQNYKNSYSANSKMGGGVILDISHEIDYVDYLINGIDSITGQFNRITDLTVDVEDYADILVNSSTCSANIHINFMSHYQERTIQADFQDFSIYADLITGCLKKYVKEELIDEKKFTIDSDYTFKKQLEYFLNNQGNTNKMNNIYEASILLKKIIDFKERGSFA